MQYTELYEEMPIVMASALDKNGELRKNETIYYVCDIKRTNCHIKWYPKNDKTKKKEWTSYSISTVLDQLDRQKWIEYNKTNKLYKIDG